MTRTFKDVKNFEKVKKFVKKLSNSFSRSCERFPYYHDSEMCSEVSKFLHDNRLIKLDMQRKGFRTRT